MGGTDILSPLVVLRCAKHVTEVWAGGVVAGVISSDSEKGKVGSRCEEKAEECLCCVLKSEDGFARD